LTVFTASSTAEIRPRSRAGQASKYSPLLREAAAKVEGEQALAEPVR